MIPRSSYEFQRRSRSDLLRLCRYRGGGGVVAVLRREGRLMAFNPPSPQYPDDPLVRAYRLGYEAAQRGEVDAANPHEPSGHERETTFQDELHYHWWLGHKDAGGPVAMESEPEPEPEPEVGPSDVLIWWTRKEDCWAIDDETVAGFPEYLAAQFMRRYGLLGSGHLWIADGFLMIEVDPEPKGVLPSRIGSTIAMEDMDGIVIHREDFPAVAGLPGFVTTVELRFARLAPLAEAAAAPGGQDRP